jgi:hypothetical protein
MKYIIVAKDRYRGDSTSDAHDPLSITEIATELVITRLYLIMLLQEGKIDKSDCVVTIEERKCLYTKIFDNVISYQEYQSLNHGDIESIDLLDNGIFLQMASGPKDRRLIPYMPFYQNWERDKDLITNVDWSNLKEYDLDSPFISLVIRKRAAWTEKNMTDEFWDDLIKKLNENNIKTFVFGKETEKWCDGENVTFIKNYRDWCSIVRNPNCKNVMSTMTGGVYPCLIFGHDNINMTIIDNTKLMEEHGVDPSFYADCINFSKVKFEFIKNIPTTEEIYEKITKYI